MKHCITFFKAMALVTILMGVYHTGEAGLLIFGGLVYGVYRVLFGNTTCLFFNDSHS